MSDTTTPATRTIDGATLPAAGTWVIDPSHSSINFKVRHVGLAKVRGRFAGFEGTVQVGEQPEDTRVNVTIDAASVDTKDERRDTHLRSADFFDVEHYPTWVFRSTGVRGAGSQWVLDGELTAAGVTRPLTFEVDFEGVAANDPVFGTRAGFAAKAEVNREDFGITFNMALETGGFVVGKTVTIELDVELVRA
jgi:polyisoprenoid-binding protein YceI